MGDEPVHLVVCGMNQQKSEVWPAKDLYTSKRFTATKDNLERSGQPWFIISTTQGLIAPNNLEDPYDKSLDSFDRPSALAWAQQVRDKFLSMKPTPKEVIFYDTGQFIQVLTAPPSELLEINGIRVHWALITSIDCRFFTFPPTREIVKRISSTLNHDFLINFY